MPDYEEVFQQSYWLARGRTINGVTFRDAFLNNLLRSCPEIANRVLTGDMEAFRSTLLLSIDHLARYYAGGEPSAILRGTAQRQSRAGRNIEPRLYEFYLRALIQTVEQYDPRYTEETGRAWEAVLRPGLEYMKRQY